MPVTLDQINKARIAFYTAVDIDTFTFDHQNLNIDVLVAQIADKTWSNAYALDDPSNATLFGLLRSEGFVNAVLDSIGTSTSFQASNGAVLFEGIKYIQHNKPDKNAKLLALNAAKGVQASAASALTAAQAALAANPSNAALQAAVAAAVTAKANADAQLTAAQAAYDEAVAAIEVINQWLTLVVTGVEYLALRTLSKQIRSNITDLPAARIAFDGLLAEMLENVGYVLIFDFAKAIYSSRIVLARSAYSEKVRPKDLRVILRVASANMPLIVRDNFDIDRVLEVVYRYAYTNEPDYYANFVQEYNLPQY